MSAPAAAAAAASSSSIQQCPTNKAPPPATHIALHMALATRVPQLKGGGIMSIAAYSFNPESRTICSSFAHNVLPVDPSDIATGNDKVDEVNKPTPADCSFPTIMSADTAGYWGGRKKEYRVLTGREGGLVHPRKMMNDLVYWVKEQCGTRATLVCNPLGAFFSFLLYYQELFLDPKTPPPWGFGAVCCRSFCSALLNVPLGQVQAHPKVATEWCEGVDPNATTLPSCAALACALQFINASNYAASIQKQLASAAQPPQPAATVEKVKWNCISPFALGGDPWAIRDPLPELRPARVFAPEEQAQQHQQQQNQKQQLQQQNAGKKSGKTDGAAEPAAAAAAAPAPDPNAPQLILYPSISDADFSVNEVERDVGAWCEANKDIDWIAQEKAHGSNLAVAIDVNGNIYASRREAALQRKDSFFQFDFLLEEVKAQLSQLVEAAKAKNLGGDRGEFVMLQLFGELCGGDYDDPRVARVIGCSRVQRGVFYAPFHVYMIFDAVVHIKNKNRAQQQQEQEARFLGYDELSELFAAATASGGNKKLLLARPLARGTFEHLSKSVNCEFPSTLPALLGMPQRSDIASLGPNFAEGIVIRPTKEGATHGQFLPLSQLVSSSATRPLVKRKHPLFREFVSGGMDGVPVAQLPSRLVTLARIASVISKMTKTERENEAKIIAATVADINKDVQAVAKKKNDPWVPAATGSEDANALLSHVTRAVRMHLGLK